MVLINTNNNKRIAMEFFKGFTNSTRVSKELYPNKSKKIKKLGVVSNMFSIWKKKNYIENKHITTEGIYNKGKRKGKSFIQSHEGYRLNTNFIFEYLKEKKVNLSISEEKILRNFLDKEEIRNFLYLWFKSQESIELEKCVLNFIRYILEYDEEVMLFFVFNREFVKEYFKIKDLIMDFNFLNKEKRYYKLRKLKSKIEKIFDTQPLLKKEQVIPLNTKNREELEILNYIANFSKKNK